MNARGKRKLVSSRISPRNSSLNNHGCGCRYRSPFPPPGEGAKCLAMIQVGLNSGDFHVNLLSFPSRGRVHLQKAPEPCLHGRLYGRCPLPKNRHHFVLFIHDPLRLDCNSSERLRLRLSNVVDGNSFLQDYLFSTLYDRSNFLLL